MSRELAIAGREFLVEFNAASGAIARLSRSGESMNWVVNSVESGWHGGSADWGLGMLQESVDRRPVRRWERAETIDCDGGRMVAHYRCGPIRLAVERRLEMTAGRERLIETFAFTNTGREADTMGKLSLFTPFNDNYPDADVCLAGRCHAHLWCGGATAWMCALRMNGTAPHLGLVLRQGAIDGYSIQNRGILWAGSNIRGDILLHPTSLTLAPGASAAIEWALFWHDGWDDFFAQAQAEPHFVRLEAAPYSATRGQPIQLRIASRENLAAAEVLVNGQPLNDSPGTAVAAAAAPRHELKLACPADALGEKRVTVTVAGRTTHLVACVVLPLDELVERRVRFIVEHQQCRDPASPLHGAFLVYDNEDESLHHSAQWPDHNAGRERLAMGVLLGLWLQRHADTEVRHAFERYYEFVRTQIQMPDGTVRNGVGDERQRGYNYPWVAQLHLEHYRLTGDGDDLAALCRTTRRYFETSGYGFYAVGLLAWETVTALRQAGRQQAAEELLADWRRSAEVLLANGTRYPRHEVNFEQSIVAPAAIFLLEMYLLTREPRYRDAGREHLRLLELFGGRQPDHRLHEIAIRHWDGYWFGKRRMWGDTLPHYWSTLTAVAFHRWSQAVGDATYRRRAREILQNNLCLFAPDGRASCAYVYPRTVNGDRGEFYDPYANDQDWALVHYLQFQRDGDQV